MILITGCATAKNEKMNEFKLLTQDVCKDNPHEVKLAQLLYLKMRNE